MKPINNDTVNIQNVMSQYSFGNLALENEISRRMMLLQKTRNLEISKLAEKKEIIEDMEMKTEKDETILKNIDKKEVVNEIPKEVVAEVKEVVTEIKEVVTEVKEVVLEIKEVVKPVIAIEINTERTIKSEKTEIDTKDTTKTEKIEIDMIDVSQSNVVPIPTLLPGVLPKKNGFQMPAELETLARTLGYDAAVDLFRIACGLKGAQL